MIKSYVLIIPNSTYMKRLKGTTALDQISYRIPNWYNYTSIYNYVLWFVLYIISYDLTGYVTGENINKK